MLRVWFNKTFSSVGTAIGLIRQADPGGRYHIIASNTNPHAAVALSAHGFAVEPPSLKGQDYLEWCLEFCRERGIDIFVPGKEASLVSGARAAFAAQGTRVLACAGQEVMELLHDKARFCQSLDLPLAPAAEFRAVNTVEQFDAAHAELRKRHPKLCVKPSVSVYGLGFAVLEEERNSAELLLSGSLYHIALGDLRRGLAEMGEFRTMLVMEYLAGHEFSVDCVGDHGRLICAVPRKKPLLAGHGQTIDPQPEILAACAQLTAAYGLNGWFNIQFRERGQGQDGRCGLGLLEINPRMSGGIGMACVAGPNLPWLGLAGFDQGYAGLEIPPLRAGIRVAEVAQAVEIEPQSAQPIVPSIVQSIVKHDAR